MFAYTLHTIFMDLSKQTYIGNDEKFIKQYPTKIPTIVVFSPKESNKRVVDYIYIIIKKSKLHRQHPHKVG